MHEAGIPGSVTRRPRYLLHRFSTERAVSRDTTAAGGNTSLMSIEEDEPEEPTFVTPEPQRYNRS